MGQIVDLHRGSSDPHAMMHDIVSMLFDLPEQEAVSHDLKTLYAAFREIDHAFEFFSPYTGLKKVSIFGSARTVPSDPIYNHAYEFSRKMAEAGFMVITGAGDGIMRSAQEGAGVGKSFGLNIILPFEQAANEFIKDDPKLITFKYFFVRKLFFVKEANALAFFPGGFGTHDEGFETLTLLQTGKCDPAPVVFIDAPGGSHWKAWHAYIHDRLLSKGLISSEDMSLFKITDQIDDAVSEITHFYRHYHSMQLINGQTAILIKQKLSAEQVESLNDRFSEIIVKDKIVQTDLPKEAQNTGAESQILFYFNRRNFGWLREMINAINDFSDSKE
ncbi:MAG: LOG family protein [Nitrospirota bacterium]